MPTNFAIAVTCGIVILVVWALVERMLRLTNDAELFQRLSVACRGREQAIAVIEQHEKALDRDISAALKEAVRLKLIKPEDWR